ncbi:MAG: cellulase family glycosylhydrolase [Clostridiales bacterium]|nr:cellulase family glycosylhydrolase [Clostridiales bacterium]
MRSKIIRSLISFLIIVTIVSGSVFIFPAQTEAASSLPKLKLQGQYLCDDSGSRVQLRGLSTHGINWYKNLNQYASFPSYINQKWFGEMHDKWGANAVRLAMYVEEYNGYMSGTNNDCHDQSKMQKKLKDLIDDGVRYAVDSGMYVIIDWHILNIDPSRYTDEAVIFFREMSNKYKNVPNVIYEICNEPSSGTWSGIKNYASKVIPAIRKNAPDSVIIVGTPTWSQDVDIAASDRLSYANLLYTFHFYAATHRDQYRDKLDGAVTKGLPVLVTEFGISEASGNGNVDENEGDNWISYLDGKGIGYLMWGMANKAESASLFNTNCTKSSGFSVTSDLTRSGKWIYKILHSRKDDNKSSAKDITSTTSLTVTCGSSVNLNVPGSSKVTWSSSDSSVATVSSGKIKGVSAGSVTITASASGRKYTCKVQVLYKDVTDTSSFWYEPTYYLTDKQVVKGYDKQTKFKPSNICTRAQMVTFIWRLMGEPAPKSKTCRFSDVKKSDYFYKACIWGNENHIVEGYKNGTFGPQITCARRHAVTFLWRLAGSPAPKSSRNKFNDVTKSDYYYSATLWASENKILAGYSDGTFRPDGKCARRQMVTFLYKYDKYINKKG